MGNSFFLSMSWCILARFIDGKQQKLTQAKLRKVIGWPRMPQAGREDLEQKLDRSWAAQRVL